MSELLTQDKDGIWQFNTITEGGKEWNIAKFDFSYAGYKYGETVGITNIPNRTYMITAANDSDITAALNSAVEELGEAGGGTVIIPEGSFVVGADGEMVEIKHSNILIKGAGSNKTFIRIPASFSGIRPDNYFSLGAINWRGNPWLASSANYPTTTVDTTIPLGAKTISVANAANINAGDYIIIRQDVWEDFSRRHSNGTWSWTIPETRQSLVYYRRVESKNGSILDLDIPIPYELNPANNLIRVAKAPTDTSLGIDEYGLPKYQIFNCGMEGITFNADAQDGISPEYNSKGSVLMIGGLVDGWFADINIESYNSIAFGTNYAINLTFENCRAGNARNRGVGGNGYGFFIRGQNILYNNCVAETSRHGFTTTTGTTSNIVIKNSQTKNLSFNPNISSGEAVDDTHQYYAHAILYDNHFADNAGLIMANRGQMTADNEFQTCGWAIVWNYKNTGCAEPYFNQNVLAVSPGDFAYVIGASGIGTQGSNFRIKDGYGRRTTDVSNPAVHQGSVITGTSIHVGDGTLWDGSSPQNVLYEGSYRTGLDPSSLHDVMKQKRQ